MRVLIATAHRALVGGVETYLQALLPRLRDRGFELGLVCATDADDSRARIDDRCGGLPIWIASEPNAVMASAEAFRPDVVFTHELPDPAADAALAARYSTLAFVHNYGGSCISGTKCHAAPSWQPCSRRLGPACLGLYLPRQCGGSNPLTALKLYRTNRRRQAAFPLYRAVLVASHAMAAEVLRNGVSPKRIRLISLFPPGHVPDSEPPLPRPRTDRVLFVGRITALKGWRELLAAMPLAERDLGRRLTLVVAGDGPDREAFETEARRQGSRVEFLGWVDQEQKASAMRSADVLAVPSVWPEPFGLVGIEAGCVGLPAVGFAVGGIRDWLIPGVSGELAPGVRSEPAELAMALVRTLIDDAHWQQLRIGAWETSRRFSIEAHLDRLVPALQAAGG